MKKLFYFLTAMFLIMGAIAQNPGDTIVVQTFIHDAWTDGIGNSTGGGARDTIGYFPNDPNLSFEKIIMCYNMRCKDNNNNNPGGTSRIGCGAYDYSCQTYVHDSTRVDSILNFTPDHIISGFNGSTYPYSTNPIYNYFYAINPSGLLVLDSIIAAADTIIKIGISASPGTLNHDIFDTISTNIYWEAYSYTYDTSGNVINIDTIASNGIININQLTYYKRYPMAFQIMSFVTPYGMGLDFGSTGETWYFDVTDYSPILKGNKQITISGGGQWQEDMDIKFLFIVGTPARDVLEMQQIWRPQSKGYGTIMADDAFEPRDVLMHPNATNYKLRTAITGHGQEGEFISQNHYLNIDGGIQEYIWPVWTECAENPVYPQGGTWIYDRAGWCPGQASDLRQDDITGLVNPGQIHNIDYGVISATGTSNYWVSSQLVSYGAPNHSSDASIIDILSPTNQILHVRTNPICSKPKIIIQNTGSTPLTSLQIDYWINGATTHEVYEWNGNLNFLEKEEVELPDPASLWDNMTATNNMFHASILSPNNGTDQYSFNNNLSSTFESAPSYPNTFALWIQTNGGSIGGVSETSWEITDNNGLSLFTGTNLNINQQYRDTLTFEDGCYMLKVNDSDDDGLDFWANNDGAGLVRIREIGAGWLHSFDSDFGKFIHHEFKVGGLNNIIDKHTHNWGIHPNPIKDQCVIEGIINEPTTILITNNVGKIVRQFSIDKNGIFKKNISLTGLRSGVYFIKISNTKEEITKKLVKI